MSDDDLDMLAAEYALGTLPASERAAVALRARGEPSLAAAIEAWERRLGPLAERVPAREVPDTVWNGIKARVDALSDGNVVGIERRLRRWKAAAFAASAIAASLLAFVGVREFAQPSADKMLVAVLQKDAQSPGVPGLGRSRTGGSSPSALLPPSPNRARATNCGSCMTS